MRRTDAAQAARRSRPRIPATALGRSANPFGTVVGPGGSERPGGAGHGRPPPPNPSRHQQAGEVNDDLRAF
ncbi:hypothetical protein DF268_22080 [Streptomyces sp. V2]|nr:hypothetical protein DF268_22080 [Streptomyces sp. V2]